MIVNQEEREVMTRVMSVPCQENPGGGISAADVFWFFLVADVYLRKDLFIDNNKDYRSTHYSNSYRLSGIIFFLKKKLPHNDKTLA